MRRELGIFETAAALSHEHAAFNVVAVLDLAPAPSPEHLEEALRVLQRRHALLGARIVREGKGFAFVSQDTPAIGVRRVTRTGPKHWTEIAEAELNTRLDAERGPLMRCTCLAPSSADDPGEVVLTFHHSVMDGVSGDNFLRELLVLLAGGRPAAALVEEPPGEIPRPAEEYFPSAYRGLRGMIKLGGFVARQLGDEVSYRYRRRGCRRPPVVEPNRCRPLSVRLPREATTALARTARRRRVTLNNALNAAMLLAVQRKLYDGRPLPMRYMVFADLRPYLDPPVPNRHLAGHISFLRYTVEMRADAEFWDLAERLTNQVEASLRLGDKFSAALMTERVMRAALSQDRERMATVALSYGGAVGLAPGSSEGNEPRPSRVRALRAFVSNFGLGPEFTAQARIFGGELVLDFVYLESDMDGALATVMADDILTTLGAAAERSAR